MQSNTVVLNTLRTWECSLSTIAGHVFTTSVLQAWEEQYPQRRLIAYTVV